MANPSSTESSRGVRTWLPLVVTLLAFLVGVAFCTRPALTGTGNSHFPGALYLIFTDLWFALAWIGAAFGFGSLIQTVASLDTSSPRTIAFVLGSAVLLWLDHVLGVLGILQLAGGAPAWGLIVLGLAAAALEWRRTPLPSDSPATHGHDSSQASATRWWIILFAPAAAILMSAAASAPGYLWDSEFGGYDVLSYHLQLSREWLAVGRITPFEHNVYSFLPSYVESAYYHLAILADPFASQGSNGAVRAATACQFLHAMFALISAGVLVQLIMAQSRHHSSTSSTRSDDRRLTITHTVALLAAAYASIPWLIVTGSMAYNELPMLLFFAGALLILFQSTGDDPENAVPFTSMLMIGFLLGCACGAKLTACGFVVIPAIIAMIFIVPRNRMITTAMALALGGFIALAPYAARNYVATDSTNPLFPFFTSIFGTAHWTPEQAARWNAAHQSPHFFDLAIHATALWNMAIARFEWAGLWTITGVFGVVGALMKSTRRLTLISLAMLVFQLAFWMALTHEQSRFLIPCAIPLVLIMATSLMHWNRSRMALLQRASITCAAFLCIGVLCTAFLHYQKQRNGKPAAFIDGIHFFTGNDLSDINVAALARDNPIIYLNAASLEPGRVFLLGDATPFYLKRPAVYHSTWDTSPLGDAIRAHPEDPKQWLRALKNQIEINYLLVNWSELDRLINRDRWYDPDVTVERVRLALKAGGPGIARKIMEWPAGSTQAGANPRLELFEIR